MKSSKVAQVLQQMRQAFFHPSEDGVLVYDDPFIGRLHHSAKQILVRWNRGPACLELIHQDVLLETFALDPDPGEACRQACAAYFARIEGLYRTGEYERAAA